MLCLEQSQESFSERSVYDQLSSHDRSHGQKCSKYWKGFLSSPSSLVFYSLYSRVTQWFRLGYTSKITELQSSSVDPAMLRSPLNHILMWHIHKAFTSPRGWWLHHCLGQPVPMLNHLYSEESFPYSKSKPSLIELEPIPSCPVVCFLGKEIDSSNLAKTVQGVVGSKKKGASFFFQAN